MVQTEAADAKVRMVSQLAGVDNLRLVSTSAGGSQVFVGSCAGAGLAGTPCSLKLIRGDVAHLRRQKELFDRVSDMQADAGGSLSPSSHGLARVLFHELVALPGDDAVLAVVTVMVPGSSFADVLRSCATGVRSLTFAQMLMLVSACFEALARAQGAFDGAFVHRDLKPSNIVFESDPYALAPDLLGETPRVALIDLDFSFVGTGGDVVEPHGTPGYLAPEVLTDGASAPTPASDVFSLGVLAHEALTGRMPYEDGVARPGLSGAAWRRFFARCEREGVSPIAVWGGLPDDVSTVVGACLALDPPRRPPAAGAAKAFRELARFYVRRTGAPDVSLCVRDVVTPVTLL